MSYRTRFGHELKLIIRDTMPGQLKQDSLSSKKRRKAVDTIRASTISTKDCKHGKALPNYMHSRRTNRSCQHAPLNLRLSGEAAFSLKNGFTFFEQYSDTGLVAGVFFG